MTLNIRVINDILYLFQPRADMWAEDSYFNRESAKSIILPSGSGSEFTSQEFDDCLEWLLTKGYLVQEADGRFCITQDGGERLEIHESELKQI